MTTAQQQNGLRHNDFARYRAYCARRLARVRAAPAVRATLPPPSGGGGGGGKRGAAAAPWSAVALTAERCVEARHLSLPLLAAERAWAHYRELRAALEEGDAAGCAARAHCLARLRKAVGHADELAALAAARGSATTAAEARAYAAVARGLLATENEAWQDALEALATARAIYARLAESPAAPRRARDLFAARAEELQPQERFAQYSLDRTARGGGGGGGAAVQARVAESVRGALAGDGAGEGGAGAGSAAGAGAGADDGVSEVRWKGAVLRVTNEKLRRLLAAAAQSTARLADRAAAAAEAPAGSPAAGADGATEADYLELMGKLDEAGRVAASEAARAAKDGKAALAADHAAVEEAITFSRARCVLERNAVAAAAAERELAAAVAPPADKAAKAGAGAASGGKRSRKAAAGAAAAAAAPAAEASAAAAPAAAAPAAAAPGDAAAPAAAPAAAAKPFFAANPWLAALTDNMTAGASADAGTGGTTSASSGGAAVNPAAARAAFAVSNWFARSAATVDEMASVAGAGGGGALPADADLVAALRARRSALLAWRAFFAAQSHVHARRFADATKLMHRAQERADATLEALRLLPAALRPRELPASRLWPTVPAHARAAPPAVVAAGLCARDARDMEALLDRVAQGTVGLQAAALLHQLAARVRRDGAFADGFAALAPKLAVAGAGAGVLPPRAAAAPTYLAERASAAAVAEAVTDADQLAPALPLPAVTPFKPLLLDLAINFVAYPDLARALPKAKPAAADKAAAAAAAPAAGGKAAAAAAAQPPAAAAGGIIGWLTGSS